MSVDQLNHEQRQTYESLISMGFAPDQAHHASIRYGSNADGAANWLFDNPDFDLALPPPPPSPVHDMPPLVTTTNDEDEDEEDLPHPSTIGTRRPPPPPPPTYDSLEFGPRVYTEKGDSGHQEHVVQLAPPRPSSPPPPRRTDIDLTTEEGGEDSRTTLEAEEEESRNLQKAIEASTAAPFRGGEEEDLEMSKALEMSMASLGSAATTNTEDQGQGQGEGGGGGGESIDSILIQRIEESIPPLERIRQTGGGGGSSDELEEEEPVMVRNQSGLLGMVSGYLQALYAVPSWRKLVLEASTRRRRMNEDDDQRGGGEIDLEGVWKGACPPPSPSSSRSSSEHEEEEEEQKERRRRFERIESVQNLFGLLKESRRSFVHCQQVVKAFRLKETQFHRFSGVETIKGLHNQLVQDLIATASGGGGGDEDATLVEQIQETVTVRGRRVLVDEWIGNPLPPAQESDLLSTNIFTLEINPVAPGPIRQTFFERLDDLLLSSSSLSAPSYNLLKLPIPRTLLFHFHREKVFTSLDQFGSTTPTTSSTGGGGGVFKVEKEIWLDRYFIKRRKEIKLERDRLLTLEQELSQVETDKDKLAKTEKAQSSVQLVKGVLEYLESTCSEQPDEEEEDEEGAMKVDKEDEGGGGGGSDERKARQERLRTSYRQILETIESKLKGYEDELTRIESTISNLFSGPSWETLGPYKLVSFVVRNGLNGRGSTHSVVLGDDGHTWYKITDDLVKERIESLDECLNDRVGVMMDAGIELAFYQLQGVETGQGGQLPENLERAVARDNHAFASTLPDSCAEMIKLWNLPPIESLLSVLPPSSSSDPPTQQIEFSTLVDGMDQSRGAGGGGRDDEETVENIQLSSPEPTTPPPRGEEDRKMELGGKEGEEGEEELEPLIPDGAEQGNETTMDESGGADGDVSSGDEVAMRLRGGAPSLESDSEDDEEEDDDDDDGEEFDEDEVELGLLRPMPENRQDWDIDYAVGKVGGKPVWLDPTSPLEVDQVECGICRKTMSLLLQVNSPDDTRPHAAARSLYVFACRSKTCLAKDPNEALKVWRTQMASPNEFFPHTEASTERRRQLEAALDSNCGLGGSSTSSSIPKPWPEWDIAAEPEPYEESYLPDPSAPTPEQAGEGEREDADAPDTISGVDKEFLIFQERIEREPSQVLRFYRLPDVETPEPLWTSSKKILPSSVPVCELCRGPREVEFQILSTLLSHLDDDDFDFDSLLVYTCLDNCQIPPSQTRGDDDNDDDDDDKKKKKTGWAREVVFKQDFTASGVRFGLAN